jgi:hypothetical protein
LLLGVLQELERRQIAVPERVSVLGFDDHSWNRYFSPSLTSVSQSTHEIGRCSFELLLQAMNGEPSTDPCDRQIRLPTELRIRNSTAPPPPQAELQPKLRAKRRNSELGTDRSPSVRSKERRKKLSKTR